MHPLHKNTRWYPWICWGIAGATYLVQYALFTLPSALSNQVEHYLSISTVGVGVYSSAFLYTYVLMQIPAGLLYDRFNTTKLLFYATLTLAAGCLTMILSNDLLSGALSRMLMGLGGSFTYIGAIYLGRIWFSSSTFPLIVGLTELFSGFGMLGSATLFNALGTIQSWHTILFEIFGIFIILSILISVFVREKRQKSHTTNSLEQLHKHTKAVLKNPIVWLTALYTGFGYTQYITLTNLWRPTFLSVQFHLPNIYANLENSFAILGFMIGCPLAGFLARYLGDLNIMMGGAIIETLILILLHYFPVPLWSTSLGLLLLGLATGSIILGFDIIRKAVHATTYGFACGFNNMFFSIFSIIASPLVGYLYKVTSNNIKVAVSPLVFFNILSILFCFALIKKRKKIKPIT